MKEQQDRDGRKGSRNEALVAPRADHRLERHPRQSEHTEPVGPLMAEILRDLNYLFGELDSQARSEAAKQGWAKRRAKQRTAP